jgi:SHS2 domain-containing protein
MIAVNGLDQTNGKTVIDAGTYHKVEINTEGQDWSFTITPGT